MLRCDTTNFTYEVIQVNVDRGTTLLNCIGKGSGNDPKKEVHTTVYTRNIKNGVLYPDINIQRKL